MGRVILLCLCAAILGAHHLRGGDPGLVLCWLSVPLLLVLKRRFTPYVIAAMMAIGGGVWLDTTVRLALTRAASGQPWLRAAIILGVVAALCGLTSWLWLRAGARGKYGEPGEILTVPLVVIGLTATLLAVVLQEVPVRAILLERFLRGGGWLQVLWVAVYGGFVAEKVMVPKRARRWRPQVWVLFSIVFYAQLLLGVLGVEGLLMTGELHLPVPAVIAAGPAFRGHGFFMAILFAVSVVVVGPAWCSWLCYLGGWDNVAALRNRWAGVLPPWRKRARLLILVMVVGVAAAMGLLGVPGSVAAWLGGAFGIIGVVIMATLSRRRGVMVHCTTYCPIGWLATRLGKVNPFRIVIDDTCTDCMACTRFCRFDALSAANIRARKVGPACTLCGDCVTVCQKTADVHYAFPGLSKERARALFLVLAVTMHASFLGIAMI